MFSAITVIVVITLSILVTRVASIALTHTGLSSESAKFQARSAYTGAGYTTTEAEQIMNFPVRRKIIYMLMLVGNAGIITTMSSLILTFVLPKSTASLLYAVGIIVVGITLLWLAVSSAWLDRWLSKIINRALKKYTQIDVKDYASILRLSGDYQITEYKVDEDSPMANKKLKELEFKNEKLIVLGISRHSHYIGSPNGDSVIDPEDVLTLYGDIKTFKQLRKRQEKRRAKKQETEN